MPPSVSRRLFDSTHPSCLLLGLLGPIDRLMLRVRVAVWTAASQVVAGSAYIYTYGNSTDHEQHLNVRLSCSHCTDYHDRGARLSWKGVDVLKGAGRSACAA